MRRFKKGTAILFIVLLVVVFVVGAIACYVPITVGKNTYLSFSGSTSISSDLIGGMYAEYEITTEDPSTSDLVDSMQLIKDVLDEDGYKNANVYVVGSKLRIEISYPWGSKTYSEAYSELSSIGSGAFYLCSSSSITTSGAIVLAGSTCVKSIEVYTNNSTKYLSINFNSKGEELYEELCDNGTVYLILGDYYQSISISSSVTDFSAMTLSDDDYENLIALEQNLKLGCMKIEVDSDTKVINTMSASLSAGESGSSPYLTEEDESGNAVSDPSFASSTAYIIAIVAAAVIIVLILALFAIKFGLFAFVILLSMIFNSYLFVILLFLIPSIELGLSGFAAIAIGVCVIYSFTFMFATNVKNEYNQGKSLSASLENSYKKSVPSVVITNIFLFISAFLVFIFSFGELTSASLIFVICAALGLFTNLLFVPFLIKIAISFEGFGRKLFMLKKRRPSVSETVTVNDEDITVSGEVE